MDVTACKGPCKYNYTSGHEEVSVLMPPYAVDGFIKDCNCNYSKLVFLLEMLEPLLIFCILDISLGTTTLPKRGKLLAVLPKFGPFWKIHIRFTLESLHNDDWASILQISNGEASSTYPAIKVSQGKLYIMSNVGNNPNHEETLLDAEIGQQYDIVMYQTESEDDDNVLKLRVDVNGENKVNILNGHWLMLENAKVFYADPYLPTANVKDPSLIVTYQVSNSDAHFRYTSEAFSGTIWKILTQTGFFANSVTHHELKVDICSENGNCCTTNRLNTPRQNLNNGQVDAFVGTELGQCKDYNMDGFLSNVHVKLSGTDGWYGLYLKVYLMNDIVYFCPINQWIDNSSILKLHCSLDENSKMK